MLKLTKNKSNELANKENEGKVKVNAILNQVGSNKSFVKFQDSNKLNFNVKILMKLRKNRNPKKELIIE